MARFSFHPSAILVLVSLFISVVELSTQACSDVKSCKENWNLTGFMSYEDDNYLYTTNEVSTLTSKYLGNISQVNVKFHYWCIGSATITVNDDEIPDVTCDSVWNTLDTDQVELNEKQLKIEIKKSDKEQYFAIRNIEAVLKILIPECSSKNEHMDNWNLEGFQEKEELVLPGMDKDYSFLYIQRGKSVQFQYNKTVTGEDPKLEVKYWCLNPATPTDGEERDIKIDEQSLVCDACVNVSTMEKKLTEDQNSISFEVKNVVGGLVALTHIKVTFKIKQECTWEEDCKKTWDFKTEDVVNPLDDLKTDDKYLLLKRNTESTLKRTVKGSFKEIFVQLQYKCNSVNPSYSKLSLTPENVKLTCDGAWNNITVPESNENNITVPESNEVFRIGNLEANISIVIAFNETESEVTITVKKSQNTDYIALKDIKVVTTENKDNGDEKFSEDKETPCSTQELCVENDWFVQGFDPDGNGSYLEIKKEINLTEEAEKLQGKSITFEYWCDSNDSSNSKEIIVDGMNKDVKCNMKKWEKSEKYNIEKGFNKSTEFFLAIRKIEVVGEKTTECTDTDSCKRNWIFEEKNIVGKDNFIDDEFFMSVGSKGIITFANQNIKSPGKVQFDYLCFDSKDSTPRQLSDTCETFKCHSAWETQTCSFNEANKEIKVTLNHDKILLLVRKIKGDGTLIIENCTDKGSCEGNWDHDEFIFSTISNIPDSVEKYLYKPENVQVGEMTLRNDDENNVHTEGKYWCSGDKQIKIGDNDFKCDSMEWKNFSMKRNNKKIKVTGGFVALTDIAVLAELPKDLCKDSPCGDNDCKALENTFQCVCTEKTKWYNYDTSTCEEINLDDCTFKTCKESEECISGKCKKIKNCKNDSCKDKDNSKCEENYEDPVNVKCICNKGFVESGAKCFNETKCAEEIADTTYCFINDEGNNSTVCKEGYKKNSDGDCSEPCTQDEKDKCYKIGADCVNIYENNEAKPDCQCKPSYYKGDDGNCTFAKAYKVSLKFLDKYNIGTRASGSLKQHSNSLSNIQNKNLWNDIKDAFSGVYGDNFKRALIENCDSNGVKIDCSILLMLGTAEYSDRLQSNQTCLSSDNNTEYCLIPPKLVVEKKSLEHVTFSNISDQCSYGSFCTPPNICVSGDKFHCKCQKGYSSVYIKKYSNIGTEDICVDIDECTDKNLNECENSTICTNLPGEYKCKCKENFKHVENNDKKCIEMCEDNPCGGRGECKTLKNDFFCKCKEGYSGRLCDTKDEILKSAKMKTIIVGAVLGSILLLVIIIAGVSISKLKSKKKVHNDDHYLEELPSQNQDRTGMKAAYDNPAMKRN